MKILVIKIAFDNGKEALRFKKLIGHLRDFFDWKGMTLNVEEGEL